MFHRSEAMLDNGVALDVHHTAFVLALGLGPIGRTGSGEHLPVPAEGMEAVIGADPARVHVVLVDQGPCVVHEHFPRRAAEVPEGTPHAFEPCRLALVQEQGDEGTPGGRPVSPLGTAFHRSSGFSQTISEPRRLSERALYAGQFVVRHRV